MTIAFFSSLIQVAPKHLGFERSKSIILEKWKLYNPPNFMM